MNRASKFVPKGPYVRVGRLGGYYDLKYYRDCDHLIGNTKDIRDWIVAQGWPAQRAHYVPNFVTDIKGAKPVSRATLDTPADAPLLVAMGATSPGEDVRLIDDSITHGVLSMDSYVWGQASPQEALAAH